MYGREFFHESVVKDIVDVITSLKDYDEVQFLTNSASKRSFKSITSATKDLILTFPVLASTDLDPANACMFAKAHEKKCASLLHMLFTAICVDSNEDVFDFVNKFHKNLGSLNSTIDDYADSLDKLVSEFDEDAEFRGKIDHDVLNEVLKDLRESNYTLPDDVNEQSIESFKVIPGYAIRGNDVVIKEAKNKFTGVINQRRGSTVTGDTYGDNTVNNATTNVQGDNVGFKGNVDTMTTYTNSPVSHVTNNYRGAVSRSDAANQELDSRFKTIDTQYKIHKGSFLDVEYKKANEMMPTMMVINFIQKGEDGSDTFTNTAIIGVKAKVYPVSSIDICNRLSSKIEDRNFLTNFVRATTNEIGFFRDFLFAIDKAKIDALSYGKKSSSNKLWKVLERRSLKSRFRRSLKMYNDATAISTLLISDNDAEYMKKNMNKDLYSVSLVRKILDSYNFMCFAIMNESTEVLNYIYDTGDDNFERLTFNNLEREASDNQYKKMVNLLTKVSR